MLSHYIRTEGVGVKPNANHLAYVTVDICSSIGAHSVSQTGPWVTESEVLYDVTERSVIIYVV